MKRYSDILVNDHLTFQAQDLLPKVELLQANLKKEDSIIIDNWECGFPKNVLEWPQCHGKEKSIPRLIQNFFEFYTNFEYKKRVIRIFSKERPSKTNVNFRTDVLSVQVN